MMLDRSKSPYFTHLAKVEVYDKMLRIPNVLIYMLFFFLAILSLANSIPAENLIDADNHATMRKNKQYARVEDKKNLHRELATKHDAKSQEAYKKAKNSCMPGGNCVQLLKGRYHKKRFDSHVARGVEAQRFLKGMQNQHINAKNSRSDEQ